MKTVEKNYFILLKKLQLAIFVDRSPWAHGNFIKKHSFDLTKFSE